MRKRFSLGWKNNEKNKKLPLLLALCLVLTVFAACDPTPDTTINADTTNKIETTETTVTETETTVTETETTSTETETTEPDSYETTVGSEESESSHAHSYGKWSTTKEATCTEEGVKERRCSCGDVETKVIKMLDHDYDSDNICIRCNYYLDPGIVFTLRSDKYSVTGYTGSATEIIIPSIYNSLPVTSIGDSAFYNCKP